MAFEVKSIDESAALEHYGVMGMKWGVRKDRKSGGGTKGKSSVSRLQEARNDRARDYAEQATAYNAGIHRRLDKKTAKAQAKADYAKSTGASSKKVAKLERKASDAKVRAEIVKERNADLVERNADWTRKTVGEKLKDPQTYNSSANYNKATKQALNNAKDKYGKQQVNRIKREDTMRTAAITAALSGAAVGLYYLRNS